MRALLILALSVACSPVSPTTDLFEDMNSGAQLEDLFPTGDVAGPPLPLDLTLQTAVFQRGEQALFTVAGAPAGRVVALAVSQDTGAPGACPAVIAPECLDVPGPFIIVGQGLADANGEITFDLPIPADLRPDDLIFQAVSIRGSRVYISDPVQTRVIDPYLDVTVAFVNYVFGYDNTLDAAVSYNDVMPYVSVVLRSDDYTSDPADADEQCIFRMNANFPLGRAAWVANEPDVLFGFDWPSGSDWNDGCVDRLDPARFGDIEAALEQVSFGIGVLDNLGATVEADLFAAGFTQSEVDRTTGAYWAGTWGNSFDSRGSFHGLYAVDGNGDVLFDANGNLVGLPRTALLSGSPMANAVFSANINLGVSFVEGL